MLINVTEYRRGNNKRHARETGNIGYTKRKTKQKHNIISTKVFWHQDPSPPH
jgi:hypothetical protein